jgi:hypothetical protein
MPLSRKKRARAGTRMRPHWVTNRWLSFTSGAACPRQPDQTPHAAIERGLLAQAHRLHTVHRNGGVGPIQRHGSKAVAGAWRLAGQDVRYRTDRHLICRRFGPQMGGRRTTALLDGDALRPCSGGSHRPVKARKTCVLGRIIPKSNCCHARNPRFFINFIHRRNKADARSPYLIRLTASSQAAFQPPPTLLDSAPTLPAMRRYNRVSDRGLPAGPRVLRHVPSA